MSPPELSEDRRSREESCDVVRTVLGRVRPMVAVVLGLGLGVALVACAPAEPPRTATSSTPTASVEPTTVTEPYEVGKVEPPDGAAYTGVFRPPAPYEIGSLDGYDEFTDKPPALLMWFQPWDEAGANEFDPALVVSTLQHGAVPLITWEPWNPGGDPNYLKNPEKQPDYQLRDILDGTYDDYIRSWARGIKSVKGPVMLRPMHEMNGSWYPWCGRANGNTPGQFRDAWRHIHDIFEEEGVKNVTWVWSINATGSPNTAENAYALYYPGDEYVDWTSASGFNWGTSRSFTRWQEFEEIYAEVLAYLRSVDKPIVLSEFATVPNGGDKAAWIVDSYDRIRARHPEIAAVVYYDKYEEGLKNKQAWQIDSSPESVEAYRDALSNPYYLGAPIPGLAKWANSLSEQEWSELRSIPPVY